MTRKFWFSWLRRHFLDHLLGRHVELRIHHFPIASCHKYSSTLFLFQRTFTIIKKKAQECENDFPSNRIEKIWKIVSDHNGTINFSKVHSANEVEYRTCAISVWLGWNTGICFLKKYFFYSPEFSSNFILINNTSSFFLILWIYQIHIWNVTAEFFVRLIPEFSLYFECKKM